MTFVNYGKNTEVGYLHSIRTLRLRSAAIEELPNHRDASQK